MVPCICDSFVVLNHFSATRRYKLRQNKVKVTGLGRNNLKLKFLVSVLPLFWYYSGGRQLGHPNAPP